MPWHSDDLHGMYHASYLGFMDQVRWEFVARLGIVAAAKDKKWYVAFGGERLFYRRPLRLFRRFTVDVEVAGWDEQWFYARHVFRSEGRVMAVGYVKTMLITDGGAVPTRDVLDELGIRESSPRMPDDVRLWIAADAQTKAIVDSKVFGASDQRWPVEAKERRAVQY